MKRRTKRLGARPHNPLAVRSLNGHTDRTRKTGLVENCHWRQKFASNEDFDPAIITKQQELYVNVDIDHGASYGQTIFVEPSGEPAPGQPPVARKMPPWWHVATVQWDLDTKRFYEAFADLMDK